MRPIWSEVSLAALRQNFRAIQNHVGQGVAVCCVVKADAYGHGAVECARALAAEGATWFGVSSTDEGVRLRESGISGRILLMTGFWPGEEQAIIEHALTPAIWEPGQAQLLQAGGKQARGKAAKAVKKPHGNVSSERASLAVHLKIDTGMTRLGVDPQALAAFCQALQESKVVDLEGAFTHLASSEVVDSSAVEEQLARFDASIATLRENRIQARYLHTANSAAILSRPKSWKNMVRPGLALYGYCLPLLSAKGKQTAPPKLNLKPVLSWKTRILALREVPASQAISYGGAYVTSKPARIAVLPVGYADGLSRRLSWRNTMAGGSQPEGGRVILRGQYAPMVGNVTMDLTMVDVTAIPGVAVGDEVTLIGAAENCSITAEEHAALAGTIAYEILCGISRRVCRKYV